MLTENSVQEEQPTVRSENGSEPSQSDRRGFVRKIVGIAAAGGLASVLLGEQVQEAGAFAVSGAGASGQVAYWTNSSGILAGFQSVLDPANNNIAFGSGSLATVGNATVGGGFSNTANGGYSTVGGGEGNRAGSNWATVGGGLSGAATGSASTVGGGVGNTASGDDSTVGGGQGNTANNSWATVAGGNSGAATGSYSTVGGGSSNTASAAGSTVAGGESNTANDSWATVGGGVSGAATGSASTVGGGVGNTASGIASTVGGGEGNFAGNYYATVGGGLSGAATGSASTVGGGSFNNASGNASTVGGGSSNTASNYYATVGGGVSGAATGYGSTVPGGFHNLAAGSYSFAAGYHATVSGGHHGAMLFSDDSNINPFNSAAPDEFAVRATGGFRFVTGIDTGGFVTQIAAINASGSLGVGTASPSDLFHGYSKTDAVIRLVGDGTGSAFSFEEYYPGVGGPGLYIKSARGSFTTPTNLQVGDRMGQVIMAGYAGGAFRNVAAIEGWVDAGTVSSSSLPSYIRFLTTPNGSLARTERMRIDENGNVGIGVSNPSYQLQLSADSAAKPGTNTWTVASDERLKDPDSIQPFTEGSDFIKRLPQPVWFRYRKNSGLPSDRPVVGWVAQDVEPVAPYMIRRTKQKLKTTDSNETETLSLNTNELPYALVNSVKEILERLEQKDGENTEILEQLRETRMENAELKARLENENAQLATRLKTLEDTASSNS